MIVSVEISYYPLVDKFIEPINTFLQKVDQSNVQIEPGKMSTLISGEYDVVMKLLSNTMGDLMNQYPSVFNLKLSNTCELG